MRGSMAKRGTPYRKKAGHKQHQHRVASPRAATRKNVRTTPKKTKTNKKAAGRTPRKHHTTIATVTPRSPSIRRVTTTVQGRQRANPFRDAIPFLGKAPQAVKNAVQSGMQTGLQMWDGTKAYANRTIHHTK